MKVPTNRKIGARNKTVENTTFYIRQSIESTKMVHDKKTRKGELLCHCVCCLVFKLVIVLVLSKEYVS